MADVIDYLMATGGLAAGLLNSTNPVGGLLELQTWLSWLSTTG
jgi:hypothetical protein